MSPRRDPSRRTPAGAQEGRRQQLDADAAALAGLGQHSVGALPRRLIRVGDDDAADGHAVDLELAHHLLRLRQRPQHRVARNRPALQARIVIKEADGARPEGRIDARNTRRK